MSGFTIDTPKVGVLSPALMMPPQIPKDVSQDEVGEWLDNQEEALTRAFVQHVGSSTNLTFDERVSILRYGIDHIRNYTLVEKKDQVINTFACKLTDFSIEEKRAHKDNRLLGYKARLYTDSPAKNGEGMENIETDWISFVDNYRQESLPWELVMGQSIAIIAREAFNSGARVAIKKLKFRHPSDPTRAVRKIIGIKPIDPLDHDIFLAPSADATASAGSSSSATTALNENAAWDIIEAVDPDTQIIPDADRDDLVQALVDNGLSKKAIALALAYGIERVDGGDAHPFKDLLENL